MDTIKLAIADDHTLFRQGISGLLSSQKGIKVVLEAANGMELLEKIAQTPRNLPDIVLMDIQMPGMNGLDTTKQLLAVYPTVKVVALSMHDNEQMVFHFLDNGASGFLAKDSDMDLVVEAVKMVYAKGYYLDERTAAIMMKGSLKKNSLKSNLILNQKETEILKLVCGEHTTKEIGEMMSLSHRTIEAHKLKIQEKIGARNVVGMVLYAMKNNLLPLKV